MLKNLIVHNNNVKNYWLIGKNLMNQLMEYFFFSYGDFYFLIFQKIDFFYVKMFLSIIEILP